MLVLGTGQWTSCGNCPEVGWPLELALGRLHSHSGEDSFCVHVHGWQHSIWLWSCVSAAREEMAYAAQPCGPYINDPSLPMLCDLGYLWQWQKVDGQLPRWVAIQRIDEPVAQLGRLGVCTAPQRPSAMLPLAMPPRGSVAFCTTPKAMPLSEPRPKKMPKGPVPPPGPPPKHLMHQQALQERPGQPQVYSHVFESLNQWQQQHIALTQQQTSLHHRAMDMQHEAMNQMHQEHVYKKQKRQHMPQQQVAMKEQQPMSTQVEQPLPLQQDVVQEQLGSTMPVPIGLGLQSM